MGLGKIFASWRSRYICMYRYVYRRIVYIYIHVWIYIRIHWNKWVVTYNRSFKRLKTQENRRTFPQYGHETHHLCHTVLGKPWIFHTFVYLRVAPDSGSYVWIPNKIWTSKVCTCFREPLCRRDELLWMHGVLILQILMNWSRILPS